MYSIRDDFNRIALLTEAHGSAGNIYHNYLLRCLPPHCKNVLEIGCGTGEFTRLLASRAERVVAIDLSPQMIRLAHEHSTNHRNIEYLTGDVMELSLPAGSYDCVVTIATLHHLPRDRALVKMKDALKRGGHLLIHDLVADDGFIDKIRSAAAYPVSSAWRLWKTGRLRLPPEVREAWDEHGRGETYPTLNEVREMCRQHLPGARVRRHLLWRYTVAWHKQNAGITSHSIAQETA